MVAARECSDRAAAAAAAAAADAADRTILETLVPWGEKDLGGGKRCAVTKEMLRYVRRMPEA